MRRHRWGETGGDGQERRCKACGLLRRKARRESATINRRAGTVFFRFSEVSVFSVTGEVWRRCDRVPACPGKPWEVS